MGGDGRRGGGGSAGGDGSSLRRGDGRVRMEVGGASEPELGF